MCRFRRAALLVFALCSGARLDAQFPSFPGAVGFGATEPGATYLSGSTHYGGNVYHVTNLNDSGPGSFRTGVAGGGNIVVFDVGGSIQSHSPVSVSSNVDIEGQTAPGGIQVFGAETSFYGHSNIICRFMHFRDGTLDPNYPGSTATNSHTNAVNMGDTSDIIMDHCCFEFAAYNNVDSAGAANITFQNCLFADPISEQRFNCHFETGPVTFIDCLWANAHGRSPLGKANLQFVNNIVYDYGYAMDTGNSSGKFLWDVVNNYFIAGPMTTNANDAYYQVDGNQQAYAIGNYMDSNRNGKLDGGADNTVNGATVRTGYWSTATPLLPTLTAQNAFYNVVSNAGPVPRDPVDQLVVADVVSLGSSGMFWTYQTSTQRGNSGYGVITGGNALPDSDASGMPDDWKAALGLSLTDATISGSTSSTGYTYLENYLAWKALPNAFVAKNTAANPSSVTIDLSQYANGFGTGSTFTLSGVTGGTVTPMTGTQSGTADFMVTFTPTVNTSGLGGFNWSVANGVTTMTSTCGVLISQSGPTQSVRWTGDGVTNAWNLTAPNWTVIRTGSASQFATGDPVTLDDTGSTSPAIYLTTVVSPGIVDVNGFASDYVITGTGLIGGNGGFVKNSTGTLTIENSQPNTFAGGVVVNSGTLIMLQALGAGPVTLTNNTGIAMNAVGLTNNTLNVTGSATLTGVNTLSIGAMSGGGTLTFGPEGGNTRFDMRGDMTQFTGQMNMGTSGVSLRFYGALGSAAAAFDLGSNGSSFYPRGGNNATYSLGSLTSDSPNAYLGGAADGVAMIWSIGGNNASTTYPGVIQGAAMSITKTGTGTLTLTGTNPNYVGTTNVNAGTLLIEAPQGNSNLTINSGGAVATGVAVSGTLTMNAGGALYLGNSTAPGAVATVTSHGLVINGGVGGVGASIYYDLSSSATGSNDQLIVSSTNGPLSIAGTINFEINMTNGTLGPGPYKLISGNSALGIGSYLDFTTNLPPNNTTRQNIYAYRTSASTNPGYVALNVAGYAGALTWTGSNGATWDLNTTSSDWTGASPSTFYNLDTVTFDDTDGNGSVSLSGTLQPNVVYVNNNAVNYTFSGTGGIDGNAQLVKTGAGALTLADGPNNTNGNIYIDGGMLYANAWLGNGVIYLNGGNLTVQNGTYLGNSIVVETNSTINATGGSDWITNNIGATLTSNGPVILTVYVANGSALTIDGAMDGFQGTFEMGTSGGLVRFNGDGSGSALFDIGSSNAWFANRNGGVTVNFGGLEGGPNTTLGGRQASSGESSSTYVVGGLNTDETFAGTITTGGDLAGLNITKVGTGNWTLSGTSSFTGNIEIVAGTLTISGSTNNNGLDFEAQPGSTFNLAGGTINTETIQIDAGASFTGGGTLDAALVNQGTALINGGGTTTINGNFENDGTLTVGGTTNLVINVPTETSYINNGTMTIDGSSTLVVNLPNDGSGTFVNNKLLDIMDSPLTVLPPGYMNTGTILNSSLVTVRQFGMSGHTFTVSIQSYTGHTYQLEKSTDLSTWQNVGPAATGLTGSAVVLTDTGASGGGMCYKIAVGP